MYSKGVPVCVCSWATLIPQQTLKSGSNACTVPMCLITAFNEVAAK